MIKSNMLSNLLLFQSSFELFENFCVYEDLIVVFEMSFNGTPPGTNNHQQLHIQVCTCASFLALA